MARQLGHLPHGHSRAVRTSDSQFSDLAMVRAAVVLPQPASPYSTMPGGGSSRRTVWNRVQMDGRWPTKSNHRTGGTSGPTGRSLRPPAMVGPRKVGPAGSSRCCRAAARPPDRRLPAPRRRAPRTPRYRRCRRPRPGSCRPARRPSGRRTAGSSRAATPPRSPAGSRQDPLRSGRALPGLSSGSWARSATNTAPVTAPCSGTCPSAARSGPPRHRAARTAQRPPCGAGRCPRRRSRPAARSRWRTCGYPQTSPHLCNICHPVIRRCAPARR